MVHNPGRDDCILGGEKHHKESILWQLDKFWMQFHAFFFGNSL